MTQELILNKIRESYEKIEYSSALLKELEEIDIDTILSRSGIAEFYYWRGCLYFDICAYQLASMDLQKVLVNTETVHKWLEVKALELLSICEIKNNDEIHYLYQFMRIYENVDEEDRPLPVELNRISRNITDASLKESILRWLSDYIQ